MRTASERAPEPGTVGFQGDREELPILEEGLVTSSHGQVVEDVQIWGTLRVEHRDVVIRNVYVSGSELYGVFVPHELDRDASFTIEDSTIAGYDHPDSGPRSAGIGPFGSWVARRVEISGFEDGAKVTSNQTLEHSHVHSLFTPPGAHADGVQATGGSDVVIRFNTIDASGPGDNAAVILQSNDRPLSRYVLEGNHFVGGNYSLFVLDKGDGHGVPRDMVVRENLWEADSWRFGPATLDCGPGWVWEDNRTSTGVAVAGC